MSEFESQLDHQPGPKKKNFVAKDFSGFPQCLGTVQMVLSYAFKVFLTAWL